MAEHAARACCCTTWAGHPSRLLRLHRLYPVVLHFSKNYPDKPPVACFPAGFFHLASGATCVGLCTLCALWRAHEEAAQERANERALLPLPSVRQNVYPDGHVCLDILQDDEDMGGKWAPSISMKQVRLNTTRVRCSGLSVPRPPARWLQVLLGLQELLDNPNERSPAQVRGRMGVRVGM